MSAAAGFGALGGAVLGGVGGFIAAQDAKRQQRAFKKDQRTGLNKAREFADQKVAEITESELFSAANDFLLSTFQDPMSSPLADDFAKGVRQAQASRGLLFGGAAVTQEASGLAAFSATLRQQLLPQALQFAQAPEQIRQSVLGFEAPLRVAFETGAAIPGITPPQILQSPLAAAFGQAAAGAAGGAMIGQSFADAARSPTGPAPTPSLPTLSPSAQGDGVFPFEPTLNVNDLFGSGNPGARFQFDPNAISRLGGLQP